MLPPCVCYHAHWADSGVGIKHFGVGILSMSRAWSGRIHFLGDHSTCLVRLLLGLLASLRFLELLRLAIWLSPLVYASVTCNKNQRDPRCGAQWPIPVIALPIAEFWTRWHMSLSQFLRDYLFVNHRCGAAGGARRRAAALSTAAAPLFASWLIAHRRAFAR